jgi:ERI1 exoribonuclease 3
MAQRNQKFDYFLVIDFEATCDKEKRMVPQEIIEFPVLKVNGKTFSVDDRFHQYVQPEINKELTEFCTELTGIIQDQVDGEPDLQKTLQLFDEWMKSQGLLEPGVSSVFVTCGDWDLKTMLPQQCKYFNIEIPTYFKQWINIKKPFCDLTGTFPKGMMTMLQMMNLKHEGRHHSGIDDCLNIARILKSLADRGHSFSVTGHLENSQPKHF